MADGKLEYFKVFDFRDDDYGAPSIKDNYFKTTKGRRAIEAKIKDPDIKSRLRKISEKDYKFGISDRKIEKRLGSKVDVDEYGSALDPDSKAYKKWRTAYDGLYKKYKQTDNPKVKQTLFNQAKEKTDNIINKAKQITTTKEISTAKKIVSSVFKKGFKLVPVVGAISSLFSVTSMGDATLKKDK